MSGGYTNIANVFEKGSISEIIQVSANLVPTTKSELHTVSSHANTNTLYMRYNLL